MMSSPDHITYHGSSRRWDYKQQDRTSPRPGYATHLNPDRAYSYERQSTRRSSTALKDSTRSSRNSFRLPRTLKDAFEATSRTVAMDSNEGAQIEGSAMLDRTPSPSRRRQQNSTLRSPLAEVTSPPPGELLETYQRINDADDLADLVSEDDLDDQENVISRRSSKERRKRRDSPGSLNHHYTRGEGRDDNLGLVFSYLDDVTDDYARGNLSTYKRDEERLSRVTTSQSPVFSKARVGSKADGLQRRESDPRPEQAENLVGEDGLHLGLNVPKSWGNKSKSHRQWLTSIARQEGDTPRGEVSGRLTERERRARVETRSRSPRLTDKSPSRHNHDFREGREQRSERSRLGAPPSDGLHNNSRARSRSVGRGGLTGDTIPNTPITIYKSTSRDWTQKPRGDSKALLSKLARTESPNQNSTPEQQKPIEALLPEKTPRVIGAWIDTPMTVRDTTTNGEDDTKEIDSPSKPASKSTVVPLTVVPTLRPSGSDSTLRRESTDLTKPEVTSQKASAKPPAPPEKSLDIDNKKQPQKKQTPRELIKPELPKSALEDFIKDAKSHSIPLDLGDDTINSLQGLMDNAAKGPSKFPKMEEESLERELDAIEADINQHQVNDKPAQSLDQMSSKLQLIIHSIQDARTGLDAIEETIAPGNNKAMLAEGRAKRCETCGNGQRDHGDGRIYLAVPIPRLWKRDRISQRLRLTYLGWAVVMFSCWYISESTMCDYYCHPTIAEVCDGYCLQPDAPQFPFTLPTMLWRWSHLSNILSPIITLFIAFFRLIAQVLGVWDGYVDDNYLSDFQWPSSSSSSSPFGDVPVGSPEYERGNGVFGLWAARVGKASSASTPLPTILQKVTEDPEGVLDVGDSMDGDEIL